MGCGGTKLSMTFPTDVLPHNSVHVFLFLFVVHLMAQWLKLYITELYDHKCILNRKNMGGSSHGPI
jgi:hypothetical protein